MTVNAWFPNLPNRLKSSESSIWAEEDMEFGFDILGANWYEQRGVWNDWILGHDIGYTGSGIDFQLPVAFP